MSQNNTAASNHTEIHNTEQAKIYDEQVSPLIKQIFTLCKEHKIQFALTVELGVAEGKVGYSTTCNVTRDNEFLATIAAFMHGGPSAIDLYSMMRGLELAMGR